MRERNRVGAAWLGSNDIEQWMRQGVAQGEAREVVKHSLALSIGQRTEQADATEVVKDFRTSDKSESGPG